MDIMELQIFQNFIVLDYLNSESNCNWICGERGFLRFLLNEIINQEKNLLTYKLFKQLSSDNL